MPHHCTMAFTLAKGARSIRPFSHFTAAEQFLYWKHMESKARLQPRLIVQGPPRPQKLYPRGYHPENSAWASTEGNQRSQGNLLPGSILKIVSWNLEWSAPDPARRATAALDHLQQRFGAAPGPLVVMLQEVCLESLRALLENPWLQRNFNLTETTPPQSIYDDVCGDSFVLKDLYWRATSYFTLMMLPKSLRILDCFRVPFVSDMGRDALCVDIPISAGRRSTSDRSIRLCTTHLESLYGSENHRSSQLATISRLIKETRAKDHNIIAGLVGGDMNAITPPDHDLHRANEVDLRDAWEDIPAPSIPVLKPFQKDMSFGKARGNTWGYQSKAARTRKRLDKFYYTGHLETVPLSEPQDVTGKIGRIGIGCKTVVEARQVEERSKVFVRGKLVEKTSIKYYKRRLDGLTPDAPCVKIDHWVSDHFGIAVGIKVRE
ncbi:hypothetical protein IQ07DRAFT_551838 [Pyrenochaeta sp. DS3sAY3a]|nr:hypothetical protein IQ07DRAFT_551838 [Pyrenochaeta sp. DS3sAY3a]